MEKISENGKRDRETKLMKINNAIKNVLSVN